MAIARAQTATLITTVPVEAVVGGRLYWTTTPLVDGGSAGNLAATPYGDSFDAFLSIS